MSASPELNAPVFSVSTAKYVQLQTFLKRLLEYLESKYRAEHPEKTQEKNGTAWSRKMFSPTIRRGATQSETTPE